MIRPFPRMRWQRNTKHRYINRARLFSNHPDTTKGRRAAERDAGGTTDRVGSQWNRGWGSLPPSRPFDDTGASRLVREHLPSPLCGRGRSVPDTTEVGQDGGRVGPYRTRGP